MLKYFILNIKHWFDRFINYYQFTFNLVEICLSRHFKVTFFFSLEVDKIKNKKRSRVLCHGEKLTDCYTAPDTHSVIFSNCFIIVVADQRKVQDGNTPRT